MDTEREHRAWHIAGHAWAATAFGFPVHKLSLRPFSAADLEDSHEIQLIDEWTMIGLPPGYGMIGTYEHTFAMERLMSIALAGPIVELHHRQLPGVIPNIQKFNWDWRQMWRAAAHLQTDETQRMDLLTRWAASSPMIVLYGEPSIFYTQLVPQLLEHGALTGAEVQATFDQVKAKIKANQEAGARRESRRSKKRLCDDEDGDDDAGGELAEDAWIP